MVWWSATNKIFAVDVRVKSWDLRARTPSEIHPSFKCRWRQLQAFCRVASWVRTLYPDSSDRVSNPRNASLSATLHMLQHECEAARCHADHLHGKLPQRNQADGASQQYEQLHSSNVIINSTYLWLGVRRAAIAPYPFWLHQQCRSAMTQHLRSFE